MAPGASPCPLFSFLLRAETASRAFPSSGISVAQCSEEVMPVCPGPLSAKLSSEGTFETRAAHQYSCFRLAGVASGLRARQVQSQPWVVLLSCLYVVTPLCTKAAWELES